MQFPIAFEIGVILRELLRILRQLIRETIALMTVSIAADAHSCRLVHGCTVIPLREYAVQVVSETQLASHLLSE